MLFNTYVWLCACNPVVYSTASVNSEVLAFCIPAFVIQFQSSKLSLWNLAYVTIDAC